MAHDAASDSQAWLLQFLQTTRDYAVIQTGVDGRIVGWLGAAEQVLGYTAGEAIGQSASMLFTPEDVAAGLDRQEMEVAQATGRSEDDRWHVRKGGIRFWGSGVMQPIRAADGTLLGYGKLMRDRTDMRTQLDALHNRIEAFIEERSRRRQFMVRLGHELRNPLAAIRAAAYTIPRLGDASLQRPCEVLDRQVGVLARLLDDLAEATRAEMHMTRILPQPLLLQDALQTAAATIQPSILAKRQLLSVLAPEVPIRFEADPARLQQMLLNLLSNACKYTPEGGRIALSGTLEGGSVVIRVEDNGVGIPDDVLPHVFDLFTRATHTAATEEGLGVGLAVVKELATLHGGGVEVRSLAEGGTVFTVRLPMVQKPPPGPDLGPA